MLSFADDSIILAESAEDLQKGLHAVNIYGNNIILECILVYTSS